MKNVVFWEAKKVPVRKNGAEIPGEFTGVFSTKVPPGTQGSVHYCGENKEAGLKWDYHAVEATVVRGHLRWVDKVMPNFTGARAQIALFLETEERLHRITLKYDAQNLNNIMNNLCGLGATAHETFLNLTYWVRKQKDANGNVKTTERGEPRWAQTLMFHDVKPQYSFEEWRDFAAQNGLQWEQVKRANGTAEWVADAELKYWDERIVKMQRYLLSKGTALPFTYGSLIACEANNPSGGGNLTTAEIAECAHIYEKVKSEYKMPFGRQEVDADSVQFAPSQNGATVSAAQNGHDMPNEAYADVAAQASVGGDAIDDDLPF